MSDMFQLVVEITDPQGGYNPFRRNLGVADLNDKLKHIGLNCKHLTCPCFGGKSLPGIINIKAAINPPCPVAQGTGLSFLEGEITWHYD